MSGRMVCGRCNKTVYFNEKVRALGKDFHKVCFKCAKCNISLQLGSENGGPDDMPYCKKCYSQTFGPKGFGRGPSIAQGSQRAHDDDSKFHSAPSGPILEDGLLRKEQEAFAQAGVAPANLLADAAAEPAASKFCFECGCKLEGNPKFCAECGSKLV